MNMALQQHHKHYHDDDFDGYPTILLMMIHDDHWAPHLLIIPDQNSFILPWSVAGSAGNSRAADGFETNQSIDFHPNN